MSNRFETVEEREAFLAEPRLAMLIYNGARPGPTGVPVWFDWDGEVVRMFADRGTPKMDHLTNDPNVSVLVTNHIGEREGWVAFDGAVSIGEFDPGEWVQLIERMGSRYWDMNNEAHAKTIAAWKEAPDAMASLELRPDRIRSGA
tara:strand:- start:577 stop:1011 length:435 start_codon:yes stop_codon:yes gene_type:complete